MCLIVFANNTIEDYKLVFAANRDEFYIRPTEQSEFWTEYPDLLAGKDLQGGGTWLGITKQGRFAAITNFRDLKNHRNDAPSRGNLTLDFLISDISPEEYYNKLKPTLNDFNGFNLLLGNVDELFYFSNKIDSIQKLKPEIHGMSNAILDTPWPKVEKSKIQLQRLIEYQKIHPWEILNILDDTSPAKDEELPDTGVGLELERMLSPIFIKSEKYGTRSSTIITVDKNHTVRFVEKTYFANSGRFSNRDFNFTINNK
ncbi:MAG TPA: NRDE family protein [Ignavibacteriaceae bacterium]